MVCYVFLYIVHLIAFPSSPALVISWLIYTSTPGAATSHLTYCSLKFLELSGPQLWIPIRITWGTFKKILTPGHHPRPIKSESLRTGALRTMATVLLWPVPLRTRCSMWGWGNESNSRPTRYLTTFAFIFLHLAMCVLFFVFCFLIWLDTITLMGYWSFVFLHWSQMSLLNATGFWK